jgi:hypothetical protein
MHIASIALLIIATLALGYGSWRWSRSHVGFGILFIHFKDGRVLVEARLLDSPAHRAGLYRYEELLAYKGRPVTGLPKEEWKRVMEEVGVKQVGEKARLTFKRTRDGQDEVFDVEMVAERIWKQIPDWGPPTFVPESERDIWHQGMVICKRTGYWIPTCRLTEQALRNVFAD